MGNEQEAQEENGRLLCRDQVSDDANWPPSFHVKPLNVYFFIFPKRGLYKHKQWLKTVKREVKLVGARSLPRAVRKWDQLQGWWSLEWSCRARDKRATSWETVSWRSDSRPVATAAVIHHMVTRTYPAGKWGLSGRCSWSRAFVCPKAGKWLPLWCCDEGSYMLQPQGDEPVWPERTHFLSVSFFVVLQTSRSLYWSRFFLPRQVTRDSGQNWSNWWYW